MPFVMGRIDPRHWFAFPTLQHDSRSADLSKEVDGAIAKGRELVKKGAPAELLVASMAEQYPMMAMYAEEVILNKQGMSCTHSSTAFAMISRVVLVPSQSERLGT